MSPWATQVVLAAGSSLCVYSRLCDFSTTLQSRTVLGKFSVSCSVLWSSLEIQGISALLPPPTNIGSNSERGKSWILKNHLLPPCLPPAKPDPHPFPLINWIIYTSPVPAAPRPRYHPPQWARGSKLRCTWLQRANFIRQTLGEKKNLPSSSHLWSHTGRSIPMPIPDREQGCPSTGAAALGVKTELNMQYLRQLGFQRNYTKHFFHV